MSTGAAIAIGAGALVLVLYFTRKQEQQTAAMIATIKTPTAGSSDGALSFKQLFQGGAIVVGTYLGGPSGGTAAAKAVL